MDGKPAVVLRDPPKTWLGSLWRRRPWVVLAAAAALAALIGWLVVSRSTEGAPTVKRPAAAPQVDVTRARGAQREPAALARPDGTLVVVSEDAAGPPRVALGGGEEGWRSRLLPLPGGARCGQDPSVAQAGTRTLVAFVAAPACPDPYGGGLATGAIALAAGSGAGWRVGFPVGDGPASAPAVATGQGGDVALAWVAGGHDGARSLLVARSRDGGRSWGTPVHVARTFRSPFETSIALAPDGRAYVVFADADYSGIWIAAVAPDGAVAGPKRVALFISTRVIYCLERGKAAIIAQPLRCVGPVPTVAVGRDGNVYVTYGADEANRTQNVYAAVLDPDLRWITRDERSQAGVQVAPPDPFGRKSDQFLPASTLARDGTWWACWYDTAGDWKQRQAWFTCAYSRDRGRRWSDPVRATSVPSNEFDGGTGRGAYGDAAAVVATGSQAHAFWTDTREVRSRAEEIFTSVLGA